MRGSMRSWQILKKRQSDTMETDTDGEPVTDLMPASGYRSWMSKLGEGCRWKNKNEVQELNLNICSDIFLFMWMWPLDSLPVCLSQTATFSYWLRFQFCISGGLWFSLCDISAELQLSRESSHPPGSLAPFRPDFQSVLSDLITSGQLWVQVWTHQRSIWELFSQTTIRGGHMWPPPFSSGSLSASMLVDRLTKCGQALDWLLCGFNLFELAALLSHRLLITITVFLTVLSHQSCSWGHSLEMLFRLSGVFKSFLAYKEIMSSCSFLCRFRELTLRPLIHWLTASSMCEWYGKIGSSWSFIKLLLDWMKKVIRKWFRSAPFVLCLEKGPNWQPSFSQLLCVTLLIVSSI